MVACRQVRHNRMEGRVSGHSGSCLIAVFVFVTLILSDMTRFRQRRAEHLFQPCRTDSVLSRHSVKVRVQHLSVTKILRLRSASEI